VQQRKTPARAALLLIKSRLVYFMKSQLSVLIRDAPETSLLGPFLTDDGFGQRIAGSEVRTGRAVYDTGVQISQMELVSFSLWEKVAPRAVRVHFCLTRPLRATSPKGEGHPQNRFPNRESHETAPVCFWNGPPSRNLDKSGL